MCGPSKLLNATVPKLEDALRLCREMGMGVKVEIKGPDVVPAVVDMVRNEGMSDSVEISCFDHDKLRTVRDIDPRIRTGALFTDPCPEDFVERAKDCGASEVHLRYDTCTSWRVREAAESGLEVMAWFRGPVSMREDSEGWRDAGNEDEDMYRIVMRSGCDMMCVNRPDVAMGVIMEGGKGGGGEWGGRGGGLIDSEIRFRDFQIQIN